MIIRQYQTLNVAAALKRDSDDTPAPEPQPATPSKPTPVRIKTVTLTGGSALFADYSITPSFATGIVDLDGTISGLSSQPNSRATVQLAGKVDRYAPVDITGEVNLFAAAKYSDIALNFRNMELTTFNPYSGKFAGYNISRASCRPSCATRSRIASSTRSITSWSTTWSSARRPIRRTRHRFRSSSRSRCSRTGRASSTCSCPSTGSLDDPKFRLGPIIWKAILGLLTKIATAPFAAIGALFGGGEEFAYVDFPVGSAELQANQIEQLNKLASALAERPQLRLDVPVTLLAAEDSKAIAAANLHARVPALADAPDEAAQRKRLTQLEALYETSMKIAPEYPAETQTESGVDWNARTAWIEARLLEGLQPDPPTLETLARQRAQAVQSAVLANTAVAPERLFITTERTAALASDGRVRMELKLE